ncbi:Hypothetical_protein [Hexamita inflata]|uniref:Hypothetical_protein n=1 Tax=Hexamita inflata TaxID=28002 RepID=A0AA86VMA4_9EUKA|nr:Hypothetical protein HINF_LOCUS58353 [Hexamita inflata]
MKIIKIELANVITIQQEKIKTKKTRSENDKSLDIYSSLLFELYKCIKSTLKCFSFSYNKICSEYINRLILGSAKQKNWLSSQIFQHTRGNQQFVTFPNYLTNLSRKTKYVGLVKYKFEVFKKQFNKVLKSVQFRSHEINSIQFASWQSASIFYDSTFVTYHVNQFSGVLLELFWLAPFRVTGQTSAYVEANVTNNSICRKENILEYQFHSELEKVRSLNKTSQLKLYAGPYLVYSHIIQIDLAHFQQLQQTKFDLKNNRKQVSPVSSVYNYIPTMTLFAHSNLTQENTQENYQNGQQTYFLYAMNNVI